MEENAQAGGMPPIAPLGGPVPSFKDIMGFEAVGMAEVMYEDDENDDTIPNIQKITKKNNILPHWGNVKTMNLNALLLENILQSSYFKNYLEEVTTFQELINEIYYNVQHLEPWERGTRKAIGATGMCGGVRGVGGGGIVSTAFCLLYKMFTLRATRKQLVSMINSRQSVYIRGMGFLFIRYSQPPSDLWSWFEPYLDDDEEVDPRSGGGEIMTISQLVRMMLTKLDFYGTLFPRIPVPIQKEIEEKFRLRRRDVTEDVRRKAVSPQLDGRKSRSKSRSPTNRRDHSTRKRSRSRDEHKRHRETSPRGKRSIKPGGSKKYRCSHHLRHHHCRKHREHCPSAAKRRRQEKDAREKEAIGVAEDDGQRMEEGGDGSENSRVESSWVV